MSTLTEYKDKYRHYYKDDQGRLQGEFKSWDYNGQLTEHCFYKDDELQGEYTEWYSNGQLRNHCSYKDGERHGECKWWDINGQLAEHCFYKDGERHREYKSWYRNGHLGEHRFYKDGKNITHKVKALVRDINNITKEERMLIELKFNIKCLTS